MEKFDELVSTFADIKSVSNGSMVLARNFPNEFYRILRHKFNGENANTETYGVRKDYKGIDVTLDYQKELIEKLKDQSYRYSPKNDQTKTNITDAPGFGSVRLCPPYEDPNFDHEFFEFVNNLVEDGDDVFDFGGGTSPFLYFLDHGRKFLVDKADIADVMEPLGITYFDADKWLTLPEGKAFQDRISGILFCFHVLEHVNNPEELIKLFSKFDVFVFATPNEEIIETSIYHHIYMQLDIIKGIFNQLKIPAFLRTSKNGLDIHGIVINNPKKWSYIKNNLFFNRHFRLYSEI